LLRPFRSLPGMLEAARSVVDGSATVPLDFSHERSNAQSEP
jgi:hypothetical protein